MMVGALTDPFDTVHMGITAENIAEKWKITREQQDAFAVESHRRAAAPSKRAISRARSCRWRSRAKGMVMFDRDEHIRARCHHRGPGQAARGVQEGDGTVTAGNASGINDAAAAVVLMERNAAQAAGLKPMARLVAYGHAGVDPKIMGIGPVPPCRTRSQKAGLKVEDMDVIESNEAFAVQALGVSWELGFDPEKVNPNGGAVALGHPIGATGAILTVKRMYELQRTGKRYGLVTMCIGGGQGIAAVIERM